MTLSKLEIELNKITNFKCLNFGVWKISDPIKFINGHIQYLKSNSGNKLYFPYYNRLLEFYQANK